VPSALHACLLCCRSALTAPAEHGRPNVLHSSLLSTAFFALVHRSSRLTSLVSKSVCCRCTSTSARSAAPFSVVSTHRQTRPAASCVSNGAVTVFTLLSSCAWLFSPQLGTTLSRRSTHGGPGVSALGLSNVCTKRFAPVGHLLVLHALELGIDHPEVRAECLACPCWQQRGQVCLDYVSLLLGVIIHGALGNLGPCSSDCVQA
jgi:hypothetical protein